MAKTRTPLRSSFITAASYDEQTQELEIEFRSGVTYRYSAVPPATAAGLLSAPSAGRYFAGVIRGAFVAHEASGAS